jgi:hypothetical protein
MVPRRAALLPMALVFGACFFDASGLSEGKVDLGPQQDRGADLPLTDARTDRPARVETAPDLGVDQAADLPVDTAPADTAPTDAFTPPPPNTVYAPYAPNIKLDGNLAEWSADGWIQISSPADWYFLTAAAMGSGDISARFALRWDINAIYLAVRVADDIHHNLQVSQSVLFNGDSVQVGFDVAQNGGTSTYDATDDFEYGWALANSNQLNHRWWAPTSAPAVAGTFVVTRSGTTTSYEIRFPLSDLGLAKLHASLALGFELIVNDNDGVGREGFLEWTTGLGWGPKMPGKFGTLKLVQ